MSPRPERSDVQGSAVQYPRPATTAVIARATTPLIAIPIVALAIAPSWLRAHHHEMAALAIAAFFSKLCHQRPERTILLFGSPIAVCIRCLGIYAGATVGSLFDIDQKTALRWFATALAANVIDVVAESINVHGNLPTLRFAIGLLLGLAAGALLSSGVSRVA